MEKRNSISDKKISMHRGLKVWDLFRAKWSMEPGTCLIGPVCHLWKFRVHSVSNKHVDVKITLEANGALWGEGETKEI